MTNFISVATAQMNDSSSDSSLDSDEPANHAMVLDCILADIQKNDQGNAILDSNGDPELEKFSFKFKNTYRNNKEIVLEAGKIEYTSKFPLIFYLDDEYSPKVFYYIDIDFVPPIPDSE